MKRNHGIHKFSPIRYPITVTIVYRRGKLKLFLLTKAAQDVVTKLDSCSATKRSSFTYTVCRFQIHIMSSLSKLFMPTTLSLSCILGSTHIESPYIQFFRNGCTHSTNYRGHGQSWICRQVSGSATNSHGTYPNEGTSATGSCPPSSSRSSRSFVGKQGNKKKQLAE